VRHGGEDGLFIPTAHRMTSSESSLAQPCTSHRGTSLPTPNPSPYSSRMPGQKGKQSARRCIDNCGSMNPRTIVRHKRDWQSSVNVKSTKFAAHMARLSSRTSGCQPDKGEPSNMGESAVMANLVTNARVTGQLVFTDIASPY
jgi:hypothetical protein